MRTSALRAITCPDCRDRSDVHVFCETCYGSGRITIAERERKVAWPNWRKKLAAVGLSAFLLALLALWRILKLTGW